MGDAGTSGGWHHDGRGLLRPGEDPVRPECWWRTFLAACQRHGPRAPLQSRLHFSPLALAVLAFLGHFGLELIEFFSRMRTCWRCQLSPLIFSRECERPRAVNVR